MCSNVNLLKLRYPDNLLKKLHENFKAALHHSFMSMKKALFYIVASEKDRAAMGLTVARRAAEHKRFSDVKVILQGESEKLLLDESPGIKDNVDYLIKNHHIDSACKFIAEKFTLTEPILKKGVDLQPAGERLAALVNDDYVPIVF
jgi:hypothetical protein